MAAACALAAAVLVPLQRHGGPGAQAPAAAPRSTGVVQQAEADTCTSPEASLPPSGASGPAIERIKAAGG